MGHLWQGLAAWRILDTDFGSGQTFLATWNAWQRDASRPRVLHYVALCEQACNAQDLLSHGATDPAVSALTQELGALWFGLLPGFHRFLLAHGQVVLTLCVGRPLALVRAQQFEADAINVSAWQAQEADFSWLLKALVRCSHRGTTLTLKPMRTVDTAAPQAALTQCGFVIQSCNPLADQPHLAQLCGRFDPPWTLKNNRLGAVQSALPIARCAVIGAGLAGASVAAALARRGWQVRVLDGADQPAAGASGLPVGLVVPHVSRDDCALSRLSRAGARLMLQQARNLLTIQQDWAPSGVLERQFNGSPTLPAAWPPSGEQWSVKHHGLDAVDPLESGIWHVQGAWIKPTSLVNAWLAQPGITFQPHAQVADPRCQGGVWNLLDATGATLCQAEQVVFANACGAFDLLHKMKHLALEFKGLGPHLPATQGMRGVLNWDLHQAPVDERFPPYPVNGSGSMLPRIPVEGGWAWFMGSSYQPASQLERSDMANQASNFTHLAQLLPSLAQHLAPAFSSDTLRTWKNTRCVTADRLPAVGALGPADHPGLWLCAGFGSRGLSFSVLCAELLAARFGAEPLPIEAKLARSLEALRA